jgi:DNA-directed RNA polymerase specialized sigma24 family protein
MIAVARRPHRTYVDFAAVPPSQWPMHDRLENWARWCRGSPARDTARGSPMFALYRSTDAKRAYGDDTAVPIDKLDAQRVAKGVAVLPDKHRRALNWSYLHPFSPGAMARELGVGLEGLAHLVRDGRQMLVNREV